MELSFSHVDVAAAASLADELRLGLLRAGVPAAAIDLKPSSPEHMSVGDVLNVAAHVLASADYIGCVAKCIIEVARKHDVPIIITSGEHTIKSPSSVATP